MSMTTFTGLKSSIANWLNRTDLSAEILDFIKLAENRISHEVRLPTIETTAVVTVDSAGSTSIPGDFLEAKYAFFNGSPLERISTTMLYSQPAKSGIPSAFARVGSKIQFYPTPAITASDVLTLTYYYQVDQLSDEQPINPLLSTAPELYLYAALVEAANFLNSDGARWENGYQTAFSRAMSHARYAEFSGATPMISTGY